MFLLNFTACTNAGGIPTQSETFGISVADDRDRVQALMQCICLLLCLTADKKEWASLLLGLRLLVVEYRTTVQKQFPTYKEFSNEALQAMLETVFTETHKDSFELVSLTNWLMAEVENPRPCWYEKKTA